MTSKAVAATLLAHGEAATDLLQYVLFSVRTSEWMCYKKKCYCDVSFALRGALVLLQELVLNMENCCAIIARPLCCCVCKCKASFQRRQFRVTIDLGAAISIYSDASLFPGVPYLKSVAPIDLTGATGDSMRCKGSIPAPLTLSIDGFTNCKSDAYGTFTVQSGFTCK